MKTTGSKLGFLWATVLVLSWLNAAPLGAQSDADLRTQQLAAEHNALLSMLNDPNTPPEKKATLQQFLDWNARGLTVAEAKQRRAQPAPAAAPSSLADAEAAPAPAQVAAGAGAVLQGFSKNRDAAAAAKSSAALGLVKAQQELDGATREAEAKIREAQNTRNAAGASALAQRQQDAASAAAQQAAGGLGAVMGDSLVQSIQQGAQSAAQAVGGAAAGHAGSMAGSGGGGSGAGAAVAGAAAAGASTAAGQIFGGAEPAPTATGGAPPAGEAGGAAPSTPAAVNSEAGVASDASALRTSGKRYVGPEPRRGRLINPGPQIAQGRDRRMAQPRGVFDAFCPIHRIKYGGEIGKVKGCPKCEAEKYQVWDAGCARHGKYGGRGPVTGCPRCREEMSDIGPTSLQGMGALTPATQARPGQTIHTPPPGQYSR